MKRKKLTQREVIATRNPVNGAWELSAIVDNRRVSRVYYFYTKREAIRLFVLEVNS